MIRIDKICWPKNTQCFRTHPWSLKLEGPSSSLSSDSSTAWVLPGPWVHAAMNSRSSEQDQGVNPVHLGGCHPSHLAWDWAMVSHLKNVRVNGQSEKQKPCLWGVLFVAWNISLYTRIWFTKSASSPFWRFDQHGDQSFSCDTLGNFWRSSISENPSDWLLPARSVRNRTWGSTNDCMELIEPDAFWALSLHQQPYDSFSMHMKWHEMIIPIEW